MRLRQLVLACGLTSFVLSPYASALGLGEVKLKSSLNQPLEAEVKLLDTRDLTAEQILVTLASPADFERNGVDRLYFYTELQFQVDLDSADGPKVIIKSRNPVREPYLNFLIEARWTAGRLLREYTLLMDLPTFEEDARASSVAAPVTAASPTRSQTVAPATSRSTPAPIGTPSSRQSSTATKSPLNSDQYEVRANDTLWEIALRARPNSGVSVHQSMMALYRANPNAFINGDINKLRRGQVLRVPDSDEMTSVAKSEAVSQFAQATGDSSYGAQLNASRRSSANRTESAEVSGRVKLAAPTSSSNNSGQGSGANDGSGRALESELAATLEELDKTKSENTELGSRVKDLEAQIETMERLVEVSNEKLRALQVAAGQGETQVEQPASQVSSASVAAAEEVAAVVAPVTASSAAANQPPLPTPPKPVVQQPVAEPTVFESIKDNPLWLALAVLGLFGAGAAAYAYRRRQQAEQQQAEEEDVFALDESVGEQEEYALRTEDEVVSDIDSSLFEEDSEATAVAETGDVVGEADIYIAYGKLDQAEEMLVNALNKDPQSADIRMKLLEVYAQQQNTSAFDKHYALLLPVAGAALISRASELRATIAGAEEFSSVTDISSGDDFDGEFSLGDLDSGDVDISSSNEGAASVAPAAVDDGFNFDFDLDLDDDESTIASLAPAQAGNAGDTDPISEFDFDLTDIEANSSADENDISELSLDLDQLETNSVVTEVPADMQEIDEEFSFDFDGDLGLADVSPKAEIAPESLEVVADDFNLDMNVDDVDLAALDHEMESLDVDFDGESTLDEEPAIADFVAAEIAKDEAESGLDLDDDIYPLHTEDELEFLAEDLDSTKLVLTDDLDKVEGGEFASDLSAAEGDSSLLTETDDSTFELSDDELDFESLNEEFAALDEQSIDGGESITSAEEIVDLELHDEIPSVLDDVDLQNATEQVSLASSFEQPIELEQDEDLFAEALSDFGTEADELNLDNYSSDESALADLSDEEMDSELDFLADADEAATKLDLARAYIDMGDTEGAKDILSEVITEGSEEQRNEANDLLGRIV